MLSKKYFSKRGFTLVEIIVVLVILAIISAVTIPSMLGFVDNAKRKSLAIEARAVHNALQVYATDRYILGDSDEKIVDDIDRKPINQSHVLYNLLKNDATGTIDNLIVENGRVKSFQYYKDISADLQACFDSSFGISVNNASGTTNENGINNLNAEDISTQLKAILTNDSDLQNTLATTLSANANLQNTILDKAYPVGSYYISHNSTSPATLFGGTWTRINNEFLYCIGDNAKKPDNSSVNLSAGGTGGNATHKHTTGDFTLKIEHIPSHSHKTSSDSGYYAWGGVHQNLIAAGDGWSNSLANVNTSSVGGGQPHNHGDTGSSSNIPPYVAVYCWRRTA